MHIRLCVFIVILQCVQIDGRLANLIIPEDLPAGFAAIYGFAPPVTKGNDHRFGFGFRFGNHADFQVLYEIGPQTHTTTAKMSPSLNAQYRSSHLRRLVLPRVQLPILELLKRAINNKTAFNANNIDNNTEESR
ncbi:uncharacterized protein LOC126056821 [Helicoverpa armigera]|uniref:uncharacterized protein LOC126056821 n=1 Tax=Helicoverpa armigera TaxID=29058 RepID=UPI003082A9B6